MKKIIFSGIISFLLVISLAFAHAEDNFADTKKLIDTKINCDKLTNEQLEEIGEYLMEQMHPGESHETMHKTMGFKEGESEEMQFHINMAKAMYCSNQRGMMGMQNMMMRGYSTEGTFSASSVFLIAISLAIISFLVGWFGRELLGKKK